MKVYRTDEIRNVVLLGHGGSGKTSLAEAMAYVSGATNRMGSVENGNTISDFDKEEQKRKFSLSTSLKKQRLISLIHLDILILSEKWKKQSAQPMQLLSLFPEKPVCR